MRQTTYNLIMVRPKHFNFNKETAENNHFQKEEKNITEIEIRDKAIKEFNSFSKLLILSSNLSTKSLFFSRNYYLNICLNL